MAIIPSSPLAAAAVPFLEDIYSRYQNDPSSVAPSWAQVFQVVDDLVGSSLPTSAEAHWLAARLRQAGHRMAAINPLEPASAATLATLRAEAVQLLIRRPPSADMLHARYCGTLGIESSHIDDDGVRAWIHDAVETAPAPDTESLRRAHRKLVQAEELEAFLGKKFPGKKRFGLEGAESLVPLLDRVLRNAAADGVRSVVIGTMHRGRLNVLVNVLGKPLDALLAEFKGAFPFGPEKTCSADVSYHLGLATTLPETGLAVTLLPNPSHLEAVDPVVLGRVRALQDQLSADARGSVLGIVVHTDAAVVGQGVVAEMLQLGLPPGFTVGGTLHVVVNNQLGFTTEPEEGRSSRYCTGPWKAVDSLILHANGDDVDAVLRAADLATRFRKSQQRDCVIDLVSYRRNGHNEMDEPRFTQPVLYRQLEAMAGARQRLEKMLVDASVLTTGEVEALTKEYRASLDKAYAALPGWRAPAPAAVPGEGSAWQVPAVQPKVLRRILECIATPAPDIRIDPRLERQVRQRAAESKGIVWAVGEALAFGSLLLEGVPVRLSGQDVVRGAFSHRMFALTDIEHGKRHISLQHLAHGQAPFTVINSPLSEYAVLGFEYGYSLGRPQALTLWEAQFGDFANGAQILIDQFIASGQEKWRQRSGLVMLLPHGLEGQGPEHSSARIERYLQLAADGNLAIAIPTTPANYFHLLRRQAHDPCRKPLVIFAPKTLLRLPAAVSALEDFSSADGFQPLLVDRPVPADGRPAAIKRILLCCGKMAYSLLQERERRQAEDTLIVRMEQLYPLPESALQDLFRTHPHASIVWVQEEPANMGAWSWLDRRLERLAQDSGHAEPRVRYCGRKESASPAGSFHEDHAADQQAIVAAAFEGPTSA